MEKYKNFKHATPVEVRFGDLDSLNHVNNANYLTYIETARIKYFKDLLGLGVGHGKFSVILAKATVDFKLPILLDDRITVFTRCSRLGTKSFDLEYTILKVNEEKPVEMANGHTVLVAYDYTTGKTIELPDDWRKRITTFEE